jgi:tetratricopeptide (TPR) repeat protein
VLLLLAMATPAAAATADTDPAHARATFAEGMRHYDAGDYAGALGYFQDARRVLPAPELDYDVARCWDHLGHVDEAITEYRRYLAKAPTAANAAAVRARLLLLERARAGTPASSEANGAAAPAPAVTASPATSRRWWLTPTLVGGSALVLAVVGSALVGSVKPDYDRLHATCNHSCMPSQWSGLEARADAGYVFWGLAGGLAVADAVLWGLAVRNRHAETRVALSGSSLQLRF